MKNWLYIPFLILMAVTYTRVVENYNSEETSQAAGRSPASISIPEQEVKVECIDIVSKFNPHFISKKCEL
jgi:hypothetical protein